LSYGSAKTWQPVVVFGSWYSPTTESLMNIAKQIGIIGLGLMGSALAERLIGAGYAVLGFDTDRRKQSALEKIGGTFAASPSDVARQCTTILVAVFDTGQVESVVESDLLPAVGPNSGRIVLCASTCDPDRIAALAARVEDRGLHLLEMPVSGTSDQVRRGQGVGLIGGDSARLAEIAHVLDAIFPSHFHMGPVGNAGRAKLAINLILGLNRLALAEGLVFAEKMGLQPGHFLEVARRAASYSQVMDTKGPKMVRGDFSPEGRVRQTLKDVRLMLDQARKRGQQLPLAALNGDILEACVRHGDGDRDNSAVICEIRRRGTPDGK
jgi:3-hydroxyisobutyrate dehydrogenase-like beta-hydroxyacid dehydrogenase